MTNYEWIVLKIDEKPNKMICQRCSAEAVSPTPCRLEDAGEIFKTFIKIHNRCVLPQDGGNNGN